MIQRKFKVEPEIPKRDHPFLLFLWMHISSCEREFDEQKHIDTTPIVYPHF